MGNRKVSLENGEFYHIYNRGVDKRIIFKTKADMDRFFESMQTFNTTEPAGSILEQRLIKNKNQSKNKKATPLVKFVSYCLLPNHFHFILEQIVDGGISEFMKRLSGGFTSYFNKMHDRSGALFQGVFKSTHLDTNEYLLYASAYVNLNHRQKDQFRGFTPKLVKSSWEEFLGNSDDDFCKGKGIVLDQFTNRKEAEKFALDVLESVRENKQKYKDLEE